MWHKLACKKKLHSRTRENAFFWKKLPKRAYYFQIYYLHFLTVLVIRHTYLSPNLCHFFSLLVRISTELFHVQIDNTFVRNTFRLLLPNLRIDRATKGVGIERDRHKLHHVLILEEVVNRRYGWRLGRDVLVLMDEKHSAEDIGKLLPTKVVQLCQLY